MAARVTLKGDLTKRMRKGERGAATAVRQTLRDMDRTAKARSRVDTGELKAGWTVAMEDDHSGYLHNGVLHAGFNEYGTVRMSAQPMLHPAVEEARGPFRQRIRKAYER